MPNATNLTNNFLIAMPGLNDPGFHQTVTYICEHNKNGAMGIVINRPLEISLSEVFEEMNINYDNMNNPDKIIYSGGPVEKQRGFILHNDNSTWDSTLKISDEISISTSRDILEAMANNEGPPNNLIALGYAGWTGGQLESEIINNSWLNGPIESSVIFNKETHKRWKAAATLLGVNLNLLSTHVGHA